VPDERIVELYAEAELAVVPSLYEGFSLPAIEAMCTGTPLVATDGGALPEVTGADGDTVLQCPAGDAGALAAAIARGLDDAELRIRVGAAGRQRVVDRWSWRRCAEMTVDQYREVLAMPQNVEKLKRNGRV
jgi:glycosyltransferase involved in cell wall biosynthesis